MFCSDQRSELTMASSPLNRHWQKSPSMYDCYSCLWIQPQFFIWTSCRWSQFCQMMTWPRALCKNNFKTLAKTFYHKFTSFGVRPGRLRSHLSFYNIFMALINHKLTWHIKHAETGWLQICRKWPDVKFGNTGQKNFNSVDKCIKGCKVLTKFMEPFFGLRNGIFFSLRGLFGLSAFSGPKTSETKAGSKLLAPKNFLIELLYFSILI